MKKGYVNLKTNLIESLKFVAMPIIYWNSIQRMMMRTRIITDPLNYVTSNPGYSVDETRRDDTSMYSDTSNLNQSNSFRGNTGNSSNHSNRILVIK